MARVKKLPTHLSLMLPDDLAGHVQHIADSGEVSKGAVVRLLLRLGLTKYLGMNDREKKRALGD